MRIFLSWSGVQSKAVATALHQWLPKVLQEAKPYISTEATKGTRWALDIGQELDTAAYGIVVVTPSNRDAPWLLYEAGALSKKLGAHVTPFVLDMTPSDLTGPLTAFQATEATLDDVIRLVRAIHTTGGLSVDPNILPEIVQRWWPDLKDQIERAANESEDGARPRRTVDSMMEEVLSVVRSLDRRVPPPRRHINPGDTVIFPDPSTEGRQLMSISVDRKLAALLNSGYGFERADIAPTASGQITFTGRVLGETPESSSDSPAVGQWSQNREDKVGDRRGPETFEASSDTPKR